jgi:FixJ family two-component response regulator
MGQTAPIIAVVDVDVSMRRALRKLLRSVRLPVETLVSAQEFLAADRWGQIGCLILDIHLPGMTDFELQPHLEALELVIPIVFILAHDDGPTQERAEHSDAVV